MNSWTDTFGTLFLASVFEWATGGDYSAALGMGFVAKDLFSN